MILHVHWSKLMCPQTYKLECKNPSQMVNTKMTNDLIQKGSYILRTMFSAPCTPFSKGDLTFGFIVLINQDS